MTKPEAPDRRRRQVATALLTVVARDGLEGTSLAKVAAEAGTSVGLIQRYFRSKDELLAFAFAYLDERTMERVAAVRGTEETITERLVQGLAALLPLDEERLLEARMLVAYMARAAVDPRVARPHAEGLGRIRDGCAEAIRLAQAAGEAPAGLEPEREAVALAALADGLLVDILADPAALSAEDAEDVLRRHVRRLFGQERGC